MTAPDIDEALFGDHLATITARWEEAMALARLDAVVIEAGNAQLYFQDDQPVPFRPNPHFAHWFPSRDCEHARLLLRPGQKPQLFFHQPRDFWHLPPAAPEWAAPWFDIQLFHDLEALMHSVEAAVQRCNRTAWIGEAVGSGDQAEARNPALLLAPVDYARAYKTPFEQDCLGAATARAVAGHLAARQAFSSGASEFDIHMAYLEASRQTAADLPYSSIVALNEHAGVLHYQHYDRKPPPERHSFLIDAGATHLGYAADVTRTYAATRGLFADLVERLDQEQQALIGEIRCGERYLALHERMHQRLAAVLVDAELANGSAEAVFEAGVTRAFLPHGLGHLLGLQTHDVGGQQTRPEGGLEAPPDIYPSLRLTRTIEPDLVFTIEPGLYLIPMLLEALRSEPAGRLVRWEAVETLLPFGGIRIEDNVLVRERGIENLTRRAFAAAGDHN